MEILEIIILALALSLDATIVSFSQGLLCTKKKIINSLLLGAFCGFFQFLMPIIGYFFTRPISNYLENFSRIIVFAIFMLLGLKFIFDAFKQDEKPEIKCVLDVKYLLIIALATSIDALGAGVSFSLLKVSPYLPSTVIGAITFINALLGFWFAKLFKLPTKFLTILAGAALILLAIKNLF